MLRDGPPPQSSTQARPCPGPVSAEPAMLPRGPWGAGPPEPHALAGVNRGQPPRGATLPHMFSASSSDEATARAAGVGRPGRAPQLGPRPRSGPRQAWRPRRWDLGGRMAPWHVETLGPICSKLDPTSCSQGTERWPPRAYPLEPTAPHKGGTPASLGVHPLPAHPSPSLWVNSFTPQPPAPLLTDGDPEAQRGVTCPAQALW